MANELVILPMFILVLLTLTVMIILLRRRIAAVKAGEIEASFYKTYQGDIEPRAVKQASRHYSNLFETPVLFYAACLTALSVGVANTSFQCLAWAYVLTRIAHAIIHLGRNRIPRRMQVYGLSLLLLLLMWLHLTISVLTNLSE